MEESSKTVYFAKCVSCGKLTFIDLLDGEQRCEYCREAKRTQAHVLSKKKPKGKKKEVGCYGTYRARPQGKAAAVRPEDTETTKKGEAHEASGVHHGCRGEQGV